MGSETQTSDLFLVDLIDNGNRSSREALYLFGSGIDGLQILNESTLFIGDIPLYALLDGGMTDIHDLFGEGITQIEFGEGYISTATIPIPAAVWLLGSGLLALVGIRRRR